MRQLLCFKPFTDYHRQQEALKGQLQQQPLAVAAETRAMAQAHYERAHSIGAECLVICLVMLKAAPGLHHS